MAVHAALPATETEWREYVEARAPFSAEDYARYLDEQEGVLDELLAEKAVERFFEEDPWHVLKSVKGW